MSDHSLKVYSMATSIIDTLLGNNSVLTKSYLADTIRLTKSIQIKNDVEAKLYNDYIKLTYPSVTINTADRTTWRYYKHLSGQYHSVDVMMSVISIDNGDTIDLTISNLLLHKKTKQELLKFDKFYLELVNKYPEQELLLKSLITTALYTDISKIIALDNYKIVSYDANLVEELEQDLIYELQEEIDRYKTIRLLPSYQLSDNLYMASMYHIFYNFILTTIIGIRQRNDKTAKAHSYHIRHYLSSHHYLDNVLNYLTKRQALFLYKNMLYLDNHSGSNLVFETLIDRLFTERNISVVNYTLHQTNSLDTENFMKYKFNQRLLNSENLVFSQAEYSLDSLLDKEDPLRLGNPKERLFHQSSIDHKFKNTLFNTLLTKDLETSVIDNTDTVRYKLIPMMVSYWAYMLKTNSINFLVQLIDPITNKELRLTTKDLFKYYTLVLFKTYGVDLTVFPDFRINNIFKPTLPSTSLLLSKCYNKKYWYKDEIEAIKFAIPKYNRVVTSSQFQTFMMEMYELNIGIWTYLSGLSDMDDNGQFEAMITEMREDITYEFDGESVADFKTRLNITSLDDYTLDTLNKILFTMLDNLFDNKLDFLNIYKYIQQALIETFTQFNSYTVQLINNYYNNDGILAGPKDPRYAHTYSETNEVSAQNFDRMNIEGSVKYTDGYSYRYQSTYQETIRTSSTTVLPIHADHRYEHIKHDIFDIRISPLTVLSIDSSASVGTVPTSDHLLFLAMNP